MNSKPREIAALLVCAGVVILFPPFALIFSKVDRFFDIPLPVLYVFGTWLILVFGAFVVSRILPDTED